MAIKTYQWKTDASIISGGYPGEDVGVIGGSTDWTDTTSETGSAYEEYYFRDSDYLTNVNSSRVVVGIRESWTASFDNRNNLTITLQSQIESIRRDDVVGNPGANTRNMFARREEGGAVVWSVLNDPINTAHSIVSAPIVLSSYTFTLAPGQNLYRPSIYFRANVSGHDDDVIPSIYVDLMGLGVSIRNVQLADYRPGKTKTTNDWLSHNRSSGWAGVYDGTSFKEMRTLDGGIGTGNPPLIKHSDAWRNMRLIGAE